MVSAPESQGALLSVPHAHGVYRVSLQQVQKLPPSASKNAIHAGKSLDTEGAPVLVGAADGLADVGAKVCPRIVGVLVGLCEGKGVG